MLFISNNITTEFATELFIISFVNTVRHVYTVINNWCHHCNDVDSTSFGGSGRRCLARQLSNTRPIVSPLSSKNGDVTCMYLPNNKSRWWSVWVPAVPWTITRPDDMSFVRSCWSEPCISNIWLCCRSPCVLLGCRYRVLCCSGTRVLDRVFFEYNGNRHWCYIDIAVVRRSLKPVRWPLFCHRQANSGTVCHEQLRQPDISSFAQFKRSLKTLIFVSWTAAPCVWSLNVKGADQKYSYLLTYIERNRAPTGGLLSCLATIFACRTAKPTT